MEFKVTEHSETDHWYVADEKMWLNADKSKLVADGDPDAAFLFATPGKRVSPEDAERYGLLKSKAKGEDKQRKASANK